MRLAMQNPERNEDDDPSPASILVVDDTPANLQVLSGMLKDRGYRVRPVPNGRLALGAARNEPPDLILLDINMPEMNGFEVCEQLKADADLRAVPVIFISALTDTFDKVKAFRLGGVDYITKPFQFEEVEARIATHLELHRLRDELTAQNRELASANQRLRELEALRDSLMFMLVHDLRSPLSGIYTYLQILSADLADQLTAESREDIAQALKSSGVLMEMINNLLDIGRLEAGELPLEREPVNLETVVAEAVGLIGCARVTVVRPPAPVVVAADQSLITRVVTNLIGNAVKFTPEPDAVWVEITGDSERARVAVRDEGPGIPAEYHEKIFERFGQVEAHRDRKNRSTGLGLAFCRLAVEAHGGRIGVESAAGKGSEFWLELPHERLGS